MTHHFGICHVYTWYIPDIWYEYTWNSVEQFCMRMVQSENSLASALQFTHPWHAITALEWIKIHCFSNSIYMVYTMYIPCIYLGLWIYMVYTWYIHGICDHRDSRCGPAAYARQSILNLRKRIACYPRKAIFFCYSTVRTNLSSQRLYNCLQRFTIPVGGRFALGLQNG